MVQQRPLGLHTDSLCGFEWKAKVSSFSVPPALPVVYRGRSLDVCWLIEEEIATAVHRWGYEGTGPGDQESFHVVCTSSWCIHVVSVRAIFTEWLYGSDLGSSGCSDRIHCKYTVISCMWWTVDSTGPSQACILRKHFHILLWHVIKVNRITAATDKERGKKKGVEKSKRECNKQLRQMICKHFPSPCWEPPII